MANQLTEQHLHLMIGSAVISHGELTDEFSHCEIPTLKSHINNEFLRQCTNFCRFEMKYWLADCVKAGSSDFIRKFLVAKRDQTELLKMFPEQLQSRFLLLKEESRESLLIECRRLFDKLRAKFVPIQSGEQFRNFLVEWLQSGCMSLSVWKIFRHWNRVGLNLNFLKTVNWPTEVEKDSKWREFQHLLKNVKTDNFVQINELQELLNLLLVEPSLYHEKEGTVKVIGRTVYLSEWVKKIENAIRASRATQIMLFIEDSLVIDCDLDNCIWQGKNLTIVSTVVSVWKNSIIRLSGASFPPGRTKAASSSCIKLAGEEGEAGRPGESSGNVAILTKKMFHPSNLTVELNGGRGEDGQDGGDGCDGCNGVGVTKAELDRLLVQYYSLYRDSWNNFQNYSPPSNWIKQRDDGTPGDFIYRTFKDEHGRVLTFSFASDKGWIYTTLELFFLICGSDGTAGTSGGSNGVGGQGGYHGTCTVQNPETGEEFPITILRNGKHGGPNGENGSVGKSGKCGINGNDLALIDRSAQEASKHYEGKVNRKLGRKYVYKAEYKSRLDGSRRYVAKENACFIEFIKGEKIDTNERRASKAIERTVRTAKSKATAKHSIIIGDVLAEAATIFNQEQAFLQSVCQSTAETNFDEDEVEEEESEAVNEEVVVLRQKEDSNKLTKFTAENEKKKRPIHTPSSFVQYVTSMGRRTTVSTYAQILFDLFTIEFPPTLLDSISLQTLFHQIHYRQRIQSSLALVVVAALQAKIVNGKSYDEIKEFTEKLTVRRKRKFNSTRFRGKLQNISIEVDSVPVNPSMTVVICDKRQFGIKASPLSDRLTFYKNHKNVEKVVKVFFSQYIHKQFNDQVLCAFNNFLISLDKVKQQKFETFRQSESFDWTDKTSVAHNFLGMTAWLNEEAENQDKDDNVQSQLRSQPMRSKTKLESDFEDFLSEMLKNFKFWKKVIEPFRKLISANSEYKARFGPCPKFEDSEGFISRGESLIFGKSGKKKSIEQAQYLILIYFLARTILTFNRSLYICNVLMLKETKEFSGDLSLEDIEGDENDFQSFLSKLAEKPVRSDWNDCALYMMKHGLACGAFQYLLSHHLNVKLCIYRQESFQTLVKRETFNGTASECEMLWLQEANDEEAVGFSPDEAFRTFVAAQQTIVGKYQSDLMVELSSLDTLDFNQLENRLAFSSFFPRPLHSSVIEWMESYMAILGDQSLLRVIHNRFWIDGCHCSVFDLQFILASCALLQTQFHCDIQYLLLLANSASQSQWVDVYLYARIQYFYGSRFDPSSKIFTGIQLIPNSLYKALLAVKLANYPSFIHQDDLYKVLLMLQHASTGSEQLIQMTFDEWISIAQKQKWSENEYLLKKYGSVGYYLGILESHGLKEAETEMRNIIDEATIIPEKLIALYTMRIVSKECTADEAKFEELKKFCLLSSEFPKLQDKETKHQLITNELEQTELINWMMTGKITQEPFPYERFAPQEDRTVDELWEKISGLHDSLDAAARQKENIRRISQLLQQKEINESSTVNWLHKFDDALFQVKGIRLRDTQKMAVLCIVENKKANVLAQVNTGEGKSFIIAAIAVIRCKTDSRYVDIITSSPVLAQRDAQEMSKLYAKLDLTVAHNCSEDLEERKKSYTADIVYGDIARFQRDHLLHTFYKKPLKGDRSRAAVIVDEVDNMLLDNGNNMLYLSHNVPGLDLLDSLLIFIHQLVHTPLYSGDDVDIERVKEQFSNESIKKKVLDDLFGQFSQDDLRKVAADLSYSEQKLVGVFDKLIQGKVIDMNGYLTVHCLDQLSGLAETLKDENEALIQRIDTCLRIIVNRERSIELPSYLHQVAKLHLDEFIENCKNTLFLDANTGYVVDVDHTGKVTTALEPLITIIDSNSGADLPSSQWNGGLHQFLQLKHGCRLSPISLKAVFISNVAYLKGYKIINGLSGTLGSTEESKTLIELYDADLIKIPTNKPKVFYEHVPVIATTLNEWIQNIYQEICDQVIGSRSVLLICEDIKQVEYVTLGLNRCLKNDKSATETVTDCFTKITFYKREHDEFNFEDNCKLEPHQLIIATNLAGRGTDIKLSDSLIKAGGLHVITAFMPKNCRIEEQAYGRAARCGQPGSAQIIAFTEAADDTIQPSVFQLKMFRDNAEVHRLQSMKSFYDYHTEIEEICLEKFRSYCDAAPGALSSNGSTSTETYQSLSTYSQVIYSALLDKWALWLDGKAPLISQCAKEHNHAMKESLINSVNDFFKEHPLNDLDNSWIDTPQSLLTIGIIQMHHQNGYQAAEETFNKVLQSGHEFAAEAHYYKACMRMRNFSGTRSEQSSLKLKTLTEFAENIDEAIEHFYKARTLFLRRLQRKQREASIVAQLIEKSPSNNPKTSGFASQQQSITTYIQLILTNIDQLLGAACKPEMFAENGISEDYSKLIHSSFVRQGLISPTLLTDGPIEDWQLETFRRKYKLHRKQVEMLISSMRDDPCASLFENHMVLDRNLITVKCPLSTRSGFWVELEQQRALYDTNFYLVVHDRLSLSREVQTALDQLTPYSLMDPEEAKTLVRYSSDNSMTAMYKWKDVEDLTEKDERLWKQITRLIDDGSLKLDKMANILLVPGALSYFTAFDGVTIDDLKEFFNLDDHGAGWVISTLRNNGILQLQTREMTLFTENNDRWLKLVRVHLDPQAKNPREDDNDSFKLLFEHAGVLQRMRDNKKLFNVNDQVIAHFCHLSMKDEDDEKRVKNFYEYLLSEEILEPSVYNVWRLNSILDCSSLPACIANQIDEFLADRFAYTFALQDLCLSLEAANDNPTGSPHQLFLPEAPFTDVFNDFVNCGLAMPPRLCTSLDDLEFFNYEDFDHKETIQSMVNSNRLKLCDQTDYHLELIPLDGYISDQGFPIDSDLRAIIYNGLKVVVSRRKEPAGSWMLHKVIGAGVECWSLMKSIGRPIAEFGYAVVQWCCQLPGKIFNKISQWTSPYIEQVGQFIQTVAEPLLQKRLGKVAVENLQSAKEAVLDLGYKALDGTELMLGLGTKAVNFIGEKVTEAGNWLADTKLIKGISETGKDFGSWVASTSVWKMATQIATYLFTKMSGFCTALRESYLYYNQCRTASRRLAIEKQGLVDEHVILKTFHGISQAEAKRFTDDCVTDSAIRKHIASWRSSLVESLMTAVTTRVSGLSDEKFSASFVRLTLQNCFALVNFESEINSLLNFYAWKNQIEYFKAIQMTVEQEIPLRKIVFNFPTELPRESLFFVDTAIDDILKEFETLTETEDGSCGSIETASLENWKDLFTATLRGAIEKSVEFTFIQPTIAAICAYVASLRDENLPPSEAQQSFSEEDKSLKGALTEYNYTIQSKGKTQFLVTELHSIIHRVINFGDTNNRALRTAIKYGYPLPLSSAGKIISAIDGYLTRSDIYKSGILLEIVDDKRGVLVRFQTKEGSGKLQMRHCNEFIFFSQSDYFTFVGISNGTMEKVENASFYEALVGKLKLIRHELPRQAETLRHEVLKELGNETETKVEQK